jgi:surface antigen
VANRRIAVGKPLPRNLGNAVTWATLAAQSGLSVDGTPRAGDVLWHKNTWIAGGLGHVGFVEKVNPNGSIEVSDMNYPIWNGVSYRTIEPSEFGGYLFIH